MKINKEIRNTIVKKVQVTLAILVLIRIGTFLPVPGIDHNDLTFYIQSHSLAKNLINVVAGKNTFVIGLFTLNIFPYINASILIQLILGLSPKLAKFQKDGDLKGKRFISKLTRIITLVAAVIQSGSLAIYLKQVLFDWNYLLAFEIVIWLTTGAMIILWLSELINDYGLGNGASLLIYTNIISNVPNLVQTIFFDTKKDSIKFLDIGIIFLIIVSLYGIVFLQEGIRIIPLISSKQLTRSITPNASVSSNYIPLRFNQAGVMPIILTTTLLAIPSYLMNAGLLPTIDFPIMKEFFKVFYWISYFLLILGFSAFYSKIVLNPKDISDQLQKMAVTIPGIRPGIYATFYLKQVMSRVTLVGATLLGSLLTIPIFIESVLKIDSLQKLSTTSLLILAGVILDLIREVKNIYYSNIYSNLY